MSNWIPVSERLPTREDADEDGLVLVKFGESAAVTYPWTFKDTDPESWDVRPLAWMPIPPYTPPKPGPTDEELDALLNQLASAHGKSYPRRIARDWFAGVTARIEKECGK